ncbi:MAG: hypothetical protein J5695_07820 [Bacteroidales bacterium]|nr:hypothetical protein [Bacteroidales bacterium]
MTLTKRFAAASVSLVAAAAFLLGGCKPYDDTAVWEKINDLDARLTVVENTLNSLNSEVQSLSSIVKTLEKRVYITGIVQVDGGYKISFSDGNNYTLGGGQASSNAPIIGIAESGGVYYWTQTIGGNTSWLTDANGNKIPVTGSDGANGTNGVTPTLGVSEDGYWIVSYDNGKHFDYLLDENGNPIKASCNCTSFFQSVTYANGILTFVLLDGTVIPIEVYRDDRIDNVVPEDIQAKMSDYIPLYTGVTPPVLDNTFLVHTMETVFCEDYANNTGGYAPGHVVNDCIIRFSNFDNKKNLVDFEETNAKGTDYSEAKGAFVSGSGNYFTAYFNTVGVTQGINTREALVISGIMLDGGIKNLHYAFVMVEKGDDPNKTLMAEGVFRVFKDGDGFSEVTEWTYVDNSKPKGAVDLGLPSKTLWAECNLGASLPEDYGNYYAWGETYPKSTYSWETYRWCNGSEYSITKYNTSSSYGSVDNLTTLQPSDDAASVLMGDKWHIPTYADYAELCNSSYTTWSWTTKSGIWGYLVTSKINAATLFFPAAGGYMNSSLSSANDVGYYWTSTLSTDACSSALFLNTDETTASPNYYIKRYIGLPIRAVYSD